MLTINEIQLDAIADALAEFGYIVLEQAISNELLLSLLRHFDQLGDSAFKRAGIGRQANFQLQESVRLDEIYWLDEENPYGKEVITPFLVWMESLRCGINQRLYLGLFDYESHFASYEAGAFYKKHVDTFIDTKRQGQPKRIVSTVLYLNQNWGIEDGGELVLYAEDGNHILQKILPQFGRLIIFLSEKFPHEVLPATRERKSIAGWFRANHKSTNTGLP